MDEQEQPRKPISRVRRVKRVPTQLEVSTILGPPGLTLLLLWFVANTLGGVIGALFTDGITHGVFGPAYTYTISDYRNWTTVLATAIVTGLILGGIVGVAEWLVLRRFLPNTGLWVFATSLGYGLALASAALLTNTIARYDDSGMLPALAIGLCVGICQSVVIWRRVRWAILWVFGSVLGWICLIASLGPVYEWVNSQPAFSGDVTWPGRELARFALVALCFFGVLEGITGLVLVLLLRHPVEQHKP